MNITTICVCGAGTMGSGIAQLSAQAGFTTILYDVNETMLEKSKIAIEQNYDKLISKEKLTLSQKAEALNKLSFTTDINTCKADLVIEAIIEKLEAKTGLFNQLAAINTPNTIFATNTSSLPVSDIASGVSNPERVAGMHFFNPAPLMRLVEIIKAADTSDEVIKTLLAVAAQMNKKAVVCKDAPGFIVNRVARHYYLEAMKLVEEGHTDHETADKALENAGFKMGPFKLMDLIGMDINFHVSQIVWNALGKPERLTPSPLQKAKVDAGELGRKTGKGFYNYSK